MYFRDLNLMNARPVTVYDAVSYGMPMSTLADLEDEFPDFFPVLGGEDTEGLFAI
ncbi:hypothetical protein K6M90_07390 [Rhizobium sp. 9T]|uniref:hypothetical protein n=1 Tax=Rhizobium croatiense TaxID=2867516 RepID=UPI0013F15917|nr:hypothetical protein [Rhizobium croatiense]MBY4607475.1 hypothetical protein [Rhizobium croatiense]